METLAWVGLSQSLFIALLFMAKKSANASDKILTAWLSLLAIEFLTLGLDYRFFGTPLLSSSFLLLNPAFFLYVKTLIHPDFKIRYIQLLHLLPYLFFETIAYAINTPFTIQSFFSSKYAHWYGILFALATLASWSYYNSYSIISVLMHRRTLENEFSNIESNQKITWLRFIVIFYNIYCVIVLCASLLVFIFKINFLFPHIFNYSALLVLVYILGFYGLKQTTIFYTEPVIEIDKERYLNSSLSPDKKEKIKQSLLQYFNTQQPYLNPELNMNLLAEKLNVPKHQLTEVMNIELGKNFFRFVNEYRVQAVKKMLAEANNNYSIEDMGYECGFSSKSSFFTVFKTMTGVTPLQYKNSLTSGQSVS